MKKLIIILLLSINIIGCSSNSNKKKEAGAENEVTSSDKNVILPDSLFYKIGMSYFDIPSLPYDESLASRKLKVVSGALRQMIINSIKELNGNQHTNVMYLSKQVEKENSILITIYTENEFDAGSIYLVSLDKNVSLADYYKIGYEMCDLESQTDTCAISYCDVTTAYKINSDSYVVVNKHKTKHDCNSGKTMKVETDSVQLTVTKQKFFYKKLR